MNRTEIKDLRDRVQTNINDLLEKMEKMGKPQGLKSSTSYLDADTIHGSRAELDMVVFHTELRKLYISRDVYDCILNNEEIEVNEKEILDNLTTNYEKVMFLRFVQGYTQKKVSEMLYMSEQTVRRTEKKIKAEYKEGVV